jgi:hypothetical protein
MLENQDVNVPANALQHHQWTDCVLRSVTCDLDTRTLVLDVHLPALSTGECRRVVITNCDCEFSGHLGAGNVASRRLIAEPVVSSNLAIVKTSGLQPVEGSESVIFATGTASITVTGGTASIDEYQLNTNEIPLDLSRAELAEHLARAA